jgi:hypothetical protein
MRTLIFQVNMILAIIGATTFYSNAQTLEYYIKSGKAKTEKNNFS